MPAKLKPEYEGLARKIITTCFRKNGEFEGHKKTLIKTSNKREPYAIVHQCDLFDQSSELYENLDDAVYDFIELMKAYG